MPCLSPWVREIAIKSEDWLIRETEKNILNFERVLSKLPNVYAWKYYPSDKFVEYIKQNVKSGKEATKLYWNDMANNIEAYAVMSVWRANELLHSSVNLLNSHNVLASAVLSRSLLELACMMLVESNKIIKTIEGMVKEVEKIKKINVPYIVVSEDLEELVVRLIFGTRIEKLKDYPKQINPLSYVKFISRNNDLAKVYEVYEFLCDVVHPSLMGQARFWRSIDKISENGSMVVRLEIKGETSASLAIIENVLWTLSWSSFVICSSYTFLEKSLKIIRKELCE